jgi:hypothetical protein
MSGFSYAMVESALARVFGADAMAQKRVFRGRLQHLRRLGLPSGGRGRGKAITYTKANIYELGFCLQLEQLGVDPSLAVDLLKAPRHRKYILDAYATAEESLQKGEHYFFWLVTEFMSASWSTEKLKFRGLPVFQAGLLEEFEDAVTRLGFRRGGCLALFQMTPLIREVLQAVKAQE